MQPPSPPAMSPPPTRVEPDLAVGNVLGRVFEVYGRALVSLGLLFGVFGLVTGVASFAGPSQADIAAAQGDPADVARVFGGVIRAALAASVLWLLLAPVVWPAAARVARTLLGEATATPRLGAELRRSFSGYGTAFLAFFLAGLLTVLGFIAVVVPGVILLLMWSAVVPVVAFEGVGGWAALKRSADVTRGHRGQLFWLYVVVILLDLPVAIVVGQLGRLGGDVASWIFSAVGQAVWTPILALTVIEVYRRLTKTL